MFKVTLGINFENNYNTANTGGDDNALQGCFLKSNRVRSSGEFSGYLICSIKRLWLNPFTAL